MENRQWDLISLFYISPAMHIRLLICFFERQGLFVVFSFINALFSWPMVNITMSNTFNVGAPTQFYHQYEAPENTVFFQMHNGAAVK